MVGFGTSSRATGERSRVFVKTAVLRYFLRNKKGGGDTISYRYLVPANACTDFAGGIHRST